MASVRAVGSLWIVLLATNAAGQDAPASFNMFPPIDAGGLATHLGWTEDCVTAM